MAVPAARLRQAPAPSRSPLDPLLRDLIDPATGHVVAQRVARELAMPVAGLAAAARVHRNTLRENAGSPAVQERLREIVRILVLAREVLGERAQARIWFLHQPIGALRDRTALELVSDGHGAAVIGYLEHLADGGYA